MASPTLGTLETTPLAERPELLASPVVTASHLVPAAGVAPIDPTLADTAEFCRAYQVGLDVSANCVIVAGRRGDAVRYAACVVLATTRADVNTLVRKRLDARRASFADQQTATSATGMEYGGITPIGLPPQWLLLIDEAVAATKLVVIGSGLRRSKIVISGSDLASLPAAEVVHGLGRPLPT
ncbi:MAG: YbaK/EbsC family protein [Actinomycetales bacterium]